MESGKSIAFVLLSSYSFVILGILHFRVHFKSVYHFLYNSCLGFDRDYLVVTHQIGDNSHTDNIESSNQTI